MAVARADSKVQAVYARTKVATYMLCGEMLPQRVPCIIADADIDLGLDVHAMAIGELDYYVIDFGRCFHPHGFDTLPNGTYLRIQHSTKVQSSYTVLEENAGLCGWAATLWHAAPGTD
jgi:hypothetical protein